MTTIRGGSVFDFTQRNRPVEKSVIIEDLNDFSSIHSLGSGASGITASNPYKRIVFVLSGALDCRDKTTGHTWTCPEGSFTIFSEQKTAGFSASEDTVALRIVVVNPTEIYRILEDEKAYDLRELVPFKEDSAMFVHILSCGNTKIWALSLPEGSSFSADALNSNMVYMCTEGKVNISYEEKEAQIVPKQCFYGLEGARIRLEAVEGPARLLIMKDII